MSNHVIIIGAGIAGLAAGCYAQMSGYTSQIFERHDLPGGLCTAWSRDGYTFDGCLHYLFGTAAGQPFNAMWQELGALQGRAIINHSELLRVVDSSGQTLIVYSDPDRLEEHMKALSPADAPLIEALVEGVRQFETFDMTALQATPRALMQPEDWMAVGKKVLPFALPLAKWGPLSAREFAARFQDPFLRRAIPQMFAWEEIPMMAGLSLLAYMHLGNAGFPQGGSLAFAQAIERRYRELGGTIHYNSQVEKILVQDDRAVGVRLYDNSDHYADAVISAADGRTTLFDMLDGRFVDRTLKERYDGRLPIHTQLQVSLGVARDLSADPHWVIALLDEPLRIAGEERAEIGIKQYAFDPTLAPVGKSVVEVMLATPYRYWQHIHSRRSYRTEKKEVLDSVVAELEHFYPGITQQIESADVATPVTYERYTGNWCGSTCGWLLTDDTALLMIKGMSKTLPGLRHFYMAGQWVEPGGSVPVVAMSGRNAIQLLCAEVGRPFAEPSALERA